MTQLGHDAHLLWTKEFSNELHLRSVSDKDINDAISTVHEHLTDSDQAASDAFGNPREYAASLNLSTHNEGFVRGNTLLAVFVATASFLAFGISANRWIENDHRVSVTTWMLGSGAVLLAASVWLTLSIARQVVEATVRERFSGTSSDVWSRYAPFAIALPWVFPIFAAILVAVSALRV